MRCYTKEDKEFLKEFVDYYGLKTKQTKSDGLNKHEIGLYFVQCTITMEYNPVLYKSDGTWMLNFSKGKLPYFSDNKAGTDNIFQYIYARILSRIHLIEELMNNNYIYSSKDVLESYSVREEKVLPDPFVVKDPQLCELLDKYEGTKIYPSPALCEFVANNFKTEDDIKFRKTTRISYIALIVSIFAVVISSYISFCIPIKINEEQFNQIMTVVKDKKPSPNQKRSINIINNQTSPQNKKNGKNEDAKS